MNEFRKTAWRQLWGIWLLLFPGVSTAATFGLPPCTPFELEWSSSRTLGPGLVILAIRSKAQWQAFWKRVRPSKGAIPEIDFQRNMVVGLQLEARQRSFIYRIELDDASDPQALLVRVAQDGAVCN